MAGIGTMIADASATTIVGHLLGFIPPGSPSPTQRVARQSVNLQLAPGLIGQGSMGIAAITDANAAGQNAWRASYPAPFAKVSAPESNRPVSEPNAIPAVEIPAPAPEPDTAADVHAFRSAKGGMAERWRSDAAAPPTAAQSRDDFSFADFIDVINPLQHIPGLNLAYRALTGDTIKPAETIAGGFLYGGALGGMAALAVSAMDRMWDGSATNPHDTNGATVLAIKVGKFGGIASPGLALGA